MSHKLSELGQFAILNEYTSFNNQPPKKQAPESIGRLTPPADTLSSYEQEFDPHISQLSSGRLEKALRVPVVELPAPADPLSP